MGRDRTQSKLRTFPVRWRESDAEPDGGILLIDPDVFSFVRNAEVKRRLIERGKGKVSPEFPLTFKNAAAPHAGDTWAPSLKVIA
jgi:hypothetical protein